MRQSAGFLRTGGRSQVAATGDTIPGKKYKCIVWSNVSNVFVEALVDTGAQKSAVSFSFSQKLPIGEDAISDKTKKHCVSVNGKTVTSLFTVILPVTFGTKVMSHNFEVIKDLVNDVILGVDFLKKYRVTLDFSRDVLTLGKEIIPFVVPNWRSDKPPQLVSLEPVVVKPCHICLVQVEISGLDPRGRPDSPHSILVGPFDDEHEGHNPLLISHSILNPFSNMYIEVLNPWPKPVHILQGHPLAQILIENPEVKYTGISNNLASLLTLDPEMIDLSECNLFDECEDIEVNDIPGMGDCVASLDAGERGLRCALPTLPEENLNVGNPCHPTFVPKGVLTKDGIKYLAPNMAVNEEINNNEETDIPSPISNLIDPKFRVRTDNTILEGKDLEELKQMIEEFGDVFAKGPDDIGVTTLTHHSANLKNDAPISVSYYKSPPPKIRDQINRETDRLLGAGIIRESESGYNAPLVLVRKPDKTWRYCTDFRALNRNTVKSEFPLPNIFDSLRRLENPKVFSSLDLIKGFFQIPIIESHRKYYGFSDGKRKLEYCRCPMGAKNSTATMARLMELCFRGIDPKFFLSYLDDILIGSPCVKTHLQTLRKVLEALRRAGLKLHPLKCHLAQKEIKSLGFILNDQGISPDPGNLDKVRQWPPPKDVKQVRQYLGLISYYRSHIQSFAKYAVPLTNLLQKDAEWCWSDVEQNAFELLKEKLLSGTATQYPDFSKRFYLKTDGSGDCVGAVLSQRDSRNKDVMVCCASQKLNKVEAKWASFDKEFFALVWGVRTYSHYLRYDRFTIITDNKPLLNAVHAGSGHDATGKRVRWCLELSSFEFDIVYKKGKLHTDADALSRCPIPDPPQDKDDDHDILIACMQELDSPLFSIVADSDLSMRVTNEQKKDEDIQRIIKKMKDHDGLSDKPVNVDSRDFVIMENMLFTVGVHKTTKDRLARVVVPKSLIAEFLNNFHGSVSAGHPGEKRMYNLLARIAFWKGMRKDVCEKVRTCETCQASRGNPFKKLAPLKPQKANFPMAFVQADLVKFWPPSQGCSYILVLEDHYTKYVVLYPVRDKNTLTIAKRLTDYVTRFGSPIRWGSDNGGEFKSHLIAALCKVYNIRKTYSLAFHPQSQGQCERKNRFIIQELSKRIAQFGTDWVSQLKWLEWGYNVVPHTATNFSPFRLMFGRDPQLPFASRLPLPDFTGWDKQNKAYYLEQKEQIERTQNLVEEFHQKYRENMKKQSEKNGVQRPFKVGEQVMKFLPREQGNKSSLNFDGPYKVKTVVGNTYIIERNGVEYHRPHCDLKIYEEPKFQKNDDNDSCDNADSDMTSQNDSLDDYRRLNDWLSVAHLVSGGSVNSAANTQTSLNSHLSFPDPTVPIVIASGEPGNTPGLPVSCEDVEAAQPTLLDEEENNDSVNEAVASESGNVEQETDVQTGADKQTTRVERELNRLRDTNKPGLKQTDELPEKRKSKWRKP